MFWASLGFGVILRAVAPLESYNVPGRLIGKVAASTQLCVVCTAQGCKAKREVWLKYSLSPICVSEHRGCVSLEKGAPFCILSTGEGNFQYFLQGTKCADRTEGR